MSYVLSLTIMIPRMWMWLIPADEYSPIRLISHDKLYKLMWRGKEGGGDYTRYENNEKV